MILFHDQCNVCMYSILSFEKLVQHGKDMQVVINCRKSLMAIDPSPKMAAENSNKLKSKTYTSTRKSTFTLLTLERVSVSGVISAEKNLS